MSNFALPMRENAAHLCISIIFLLAAPMSAQDTRRVIHFPGESSHGTSSSSIFDDLKVNEITTRFTASLGGRCVLPSGSNGICSNLNDCDELRPLYRRGQRLTRENFLILRSRICRVFGDRSIFFCCSVPSGITGSITGINPGSKSNLIPSKSQCGISTGGRITKGKKVVPHSHPWLVNLGAPRGDQFQQICGGSLITARHVLTASHCFARRSGVPTITHARLGDHSISKEEAIREVTLRIIDRKSPGYNIRSQENDIELLKLEKDVTFSANIRPACLPFEFKNKDFTGESLTIVGWGDTFFRSNQGNDVPLKAEVPVIRKSNCLQAYIRQSAVVIDDRQICAGVGGEDACQGDSGGPMIYTDRNSHHYLLGLISFGVECAREDFPGVYTFVPRFLDWIESNL